MQTMTNQPAKSKLAEKLSGMGAKLRIRADMQAPMPMMPGEKAGPPGKWRKEEHKRLQSEVAAIQKTLANWNPEAVAAQAKKSLTAELAVKRARVMECEAEMEMDGIDYGADSEDDADEEDEDGAPGYEVQGNPYSITREGKGWKVTNTDTGKVHSKHTTHDKAMAQFRLLEGVEHGMKVRK